MKVKLEVAMTKLSYSRSHKRGEMDRRPKDYGKVELAAGKAMSTLIKLPMLRDAMRAAATMRRVRSLAERCDLLCT